MNPLGILTNITTVAASTSVDAAMVSTAVPQHHLQRTIVNPQHPLEKAFGDAVKPGSLLLVRRNEGSGCTASGVSVTETSPEIRIATQMVTENSRNSRPRMPPMNSTGMNTAASDSVIETMVKPISFEPVNAAYSGFSPISMWRKIFSSITMASSTTKPMERIRAIIDRLSRL